MTATQTWIVDVDVVDPTGTAAPAQTLICNSYDGTAEGAKLWAADVLDWCEVYVRSARRCHGVLVEARAENRLDDLPPRATAAAPKPMTAEAC